jgi:dolichyl-phosphate-mannose-protein mannosyltransferase
MNNKSHDVARNPNRPLKWLSELLGSSVGGIATPEVHRKTDHRCLAVTAAVIFMAAVGVRALHWQDARADLERKDSVRTNLLRSYLREASRIREDGNILFASKPVESQDARMILHPPGYSILLAAIGQTSESSSSHSRLRLLQICCDAGAAALVFLIAAQLFVLPAATIAGMLVAFSPHLASYSLWLSPETLAVVPVLGAFYLIARSIGQPRLLTMIAAGALIGVSCWLRANALLLAPFVAVSVSPLIERGKRLRYAATLVAAAAAMISPVTLRNWLAYERFVPLSLGAGITMVEGIADYDSEGRFRMPPTDVAVRYKDAEWHNRPDYQGNIWVPDGVERDRARFARGLQVIRSNPAWFAGVMIRRGASMLRYNDSLGSGPAFYSPQVPVVLAEPSFGHSVSAVDESQAIWASSPGELMARGETLSEMAESSLASDGKAFRVAGDDSLFGDQFASMPIPVERHTDYLMQVEVKSEQGRVATKVTSADRGITLGVEALAETDEKTRRKKTRRNQQRAEPIDSPGESAATGGDPDLSLVNLLFASGNRSEIRFVISNNGASTARPTIEVGETRLFELGPTPNLWTRFVRPAVRGIQRNLFTTRHMVPLVAIGVALLALARRKRAIVVLLVVPAYYLLFQSAFHTEYRYILPIHYFLFMFAGAALYSIGSLISSAAGKGLRLGVRSP